ncbi:hypothetical protein P5673_022301, partial [Acropora cervicornis]
RPAIRLIAQLLGLMTSSFPGVMYGPLFYRRLDMDKTNALSQCGDFEGTMKLTLPVLEDITWTKKIGQQHLKLMVDNMTAVTVLNNMGTTHSWKLNELNKEIWPWCILRGIPLTVAIIPGKTNIVAERESRQHQSNVVYAFGVLGLRPISLLPPSDLEEWGNSKLETLINHFGKEKAH